MTPNASPISCLYREAMNVFHPRVTLVKVTTLTKIICKHCTATIVYLYFACFSVQIFLLSVVVPCYTLNKLHTKLHTNTNTNTNTNTK